VQQPAALWWECHDADDVVLPLHSSLATGGNDAGAGSDERLLSDTTSSVVVRVDRFFLPVFTSNNHRRASNHKTRKSQLH
jgi:hypothetical protein